MIFVGRHPPLRTDELEAALLVAVIFAKDGIYVVGGRKGNGRREKGKKKTRLGNIYDTIDVKWRGRV